jgi:hypothetical protein
MENDIERIRSQEADLEKQLMEVRAKRIAMEKGARPKPTDRGRPLRDVVLELLQDAGTPLNSLLLANIVRPLFGRDVPATRFGTLANDEAKSYDSSRARPVYLCHCLTNDKGQAVKRFWARSDWDLAERIIGPMTGRVHFLAGAAWIINLARLVDAGELAADSREVLHYVAADQARDAGLAVKRGEFPYEDWIGAISVALERHAEADRELRVAAAAELAARLSEREQLFGARTGLVSLPGSAPSWRSALDER